MPIKLIVIDLDETLLRKDKTYDVERFNKILNLINQRNLRLCIATGNSLHKIIDYFSNEAQAGIYFACDNGNYMVKDHQLINKAVIPHETYLKITDFLDEFPGFHSTISTGEHTYFREGSGAAYEFISRYNNHLDILDDFRQIPDLLGATKIAIHSEHSLDHNKRMTRILRERFDNIHAVTSGDGWLDAYTSEGGKGAAVLSLQKNYQIQRDETIVFGDSLNDESMMQEAKYSVAMGNADRDLLLSADYQIGTNNDNAVLTTIEMILDQPNLDFMADYLIHPDRKED